MIGLALQFVQGLLQRGPDAVLLAPELGGQDDVEAQVQPVLLVAQAEVVDADVRVPHLQERLHQLLEAVELCVVGDERVIVDDQMDAQLFQAAPLHVVDQLMAGHGVLPAVQLYVQAGVAAAGAVVVDHQVVAAQDQGKALDVRRDLLRQFLRGPLPQERGEGLLGQLCPAEEDEGRD